ncbi:outer membrane beta-barrel protein [Cryomorpha ignava]|uniref:Outer membrane beta-barrel protein n=1 Tax=Cryomorpha ignava TaxID=101383 RepID=A0A7K3WQT5_9FLAO|nr:DUF6089 family protein [Cryomorpha ignava]NEN24040.1 outer membrane beta-barrel protein [Cryomorpha ignava]
MLKKQGYIFIAIFLGLSSTLTAQYRWDYGVSLGASNYLGEIGGQEETRRDFVFDMKLNRTQYVVGAFGRYKFSPQLSANVGINYGQIKANDYNSQNPARVARNLSFRNNIIELTGRMELTLFYDNDVGGRGYYNPDFRIYGFVGAGVMKHNPKIRYQGPLSEYDGELIDLQPLQTEGVEYKLWQFTLPAGIGLYFTHKKIHRFGWEIGYRTTFTDYLDDVSTNYVADDKLAQGQLEIARELANRTDAESLANAAAYAEEYDMDVPNAGSFAPGEKRGDVTNNDGYLFTQFSYSYVIKGRSSFYKKRYSWIKKKKRTRRKSRAKF